MRIHAAGFENDLHHAVDAGQMVCCGVCVLCGVTFSPTRIARDRRRQMTALADQEEHALEAARDMTATTPTPTTASAATPGNGPTPSSATTAGSPAHTVAPAGTPGPAATPRTSPQCPRKDFPMAAGDTQITITGNLVDEP